MNSGDRVTLPSGKQGVVLSPEWLMPNHELILLDGGSKRWVLREILSAAPAEIIPHKRRKTA
jgi:hypothetical protein